MPKKETQTREAKYKAQLQALGIYTEAFDPELKTLATLEREEQRAKKEWRATEPDKKKGPSFDHPLYATLQQLRREILTHRDALGLTPKALKRLQRAAAPEDSPTVPLSTASPVMAGVLSTLKAQAAANAAAESETDA